MIYIYRRQPSKGAVALAHALTEAGIPARKVSRARRWRPGSRFVGWGDGLDWREQGEFPALNEVYPRNKWEEIQMFAAAGVATVTASREHQDRNAGWLARRANHTGGNDLLADYGFNVAFWVKKEEITKEYRLHIFQDMCIRAGRKEKFRDGAHPWIRSLAAGWHLVYDGRGVLAKHRDIAKAAVRALGLDFGAVDVGQRADGTVFVLEVNRAPGLEGRTIEVYRDKIKAWAEETRDE